MQLQKVNNTNPQPNFQARNLSRVVSTAKNGVKSVIDVYSVDKKDETFLNRFAEALKGQHLPQDSLMIGGKNAKASVLDAIKNILSPNRHYDDGLLIAVEDKKNIAGILDYREKGDIDINTLYMFKDDAQSMGRKALLLQALKDIKNKGDFFAQIMPQNLKEKSANYYKSLGFSKEKQTGDLIISDEKLGEKIKNLQNKSAISVKDLKTSPNIDLINVLNLDK